MLEPAKRTGAICREAVLAILLVLCVHPIFAQSNKAKTIDGFIAPLARAEQFSGVVIASENGKVIYEKAFGLANADFRIPNAKNTRIGIASITKPMTSVILFRLVGEKKIELGDSLAKYIPDFPSGDKITIQMLLQHRSGILHRVMPPELETVPYSSAEMVEKVKQSKLAFEPGSRRLYSSGGYAVLARVLEIASGMSYGELLDRYVFKPAGMADSLDFDGRRIMERRAQDYLLNETGYENAALKDYSFLVGAGSVFSTAADVHRFGLAVVDGKYGENVKASHVVNGLFSASGSTNGHRAYVEFKGDRSYGFAVLSNLACGSVDLVQVGVKQILEGKEPPPGKLTVPKFDPSANPNLEQFTGKYRSQDGSDIEIVLRNGSLFSSDIRLYSIRPDCFFDFRFFGEACFVREAGKIKEIKWKGATFDLTWARQ